MAFTFFFRDMQCLNAAIDALVPMVTGRQSIRIWDAGCATGPEPYTLAIQLAEQMGKFAFRRVKIDATDYDGEGGNFGRIVNEAVYSWSELERVPPELFAKYFEPQPEKNRHRVMEEVRSRVTFRKHDLLTLEAAGSDYSLIVCKNVLLHFDPLERVKVLSMFHAALAQDGLLVMEHTQHLPAESAQLFTRISPTAQLYRKIGS